MDAFVATQSSLGELARALKVSSFEGTRLRLVLSRLSVTSLGEPSINILLPLVNPEHLTALQLRYNSLDFQQLQKLAPHLKTFHNLTSLDLSRNSLHVRADHHVVILEDVLSSMPQLRRLDFAANCLKNRLAHVLRVIRCPLEFLCLASCRLARTDLGALSRWQHIGDLCELDLSDNLLVSSTMLGAVCKAATQRLQVLVLEECLTNRTLQEVLPELAAMEQLMYLSLAGHSLPCSQLENHFTALSRLPRLQVVKSIPVESSLWTDELMELQPRRAENVERLSKALNAFRSKDRSPIKLIY